MKRLVILGAGTAGTIMAAHLTRKLPGKEWAISIIDEHKSHYYQPGFLFVPFGIYSEKDVIKPKKNVLPKQVDFISAPIDLIDSDHNQVHLRSGEKISYDVLVVATGSKIVPEETEGLKEEGWYQSIFDFYTLEGSTKLYQALQNWKGGELVIHITEMPIKCPVAPLEFAFLADWWLQKKGVRKQTTITYVTPLSGAFTKQNCSTVLGYMLDQKNIKLIPDFNIEKVDGPSNAIQSFDEKKVPYDLLVSIPTNMGDALIERSGMGDELNFVPTDKHTLQSKKKDNIFVIGDATDVPASKAGSVAHFEAEIVTENILNYIHDKSLVPDFDGHANCFIETGFGKAILIDFNYEVEPVLGRFPLPLVGPLPLLKESYFNHMGKMAFRWIYWNMLLKGIPLPLVSARMQKAGKRLDTLK